MMYMSLLLLTLHSTHFALGARGVVIEYRDVYKRVENQDQCLVDDILINREINYSIRCVVCDNVNLAIIYYKKIALDSLIVESFDVAKSITRIPSETTIGEHVTFQYILTSGDCVRVDISTEAGMRYSQCSDISRSVMAIIKGYTNGWKKAKTLLVMGNVRTLVDPHEIREGKCYSVGAWRNVDERFLMDYLECSEEFMAIMYYDKDPYSDVIKMAGIKMNTDDADEVKDSILILPQRSDNEFRVEFRQFPYKRMVGTYVLENDVFRETVETLTSSKHTWSFTELKGYRNGWKKAHVS